MSPEDQRGPLRLRRFKATWPDGTTATATLYLDHCLTDDRYGEDFEQVDPSDPRAAIKILASAQELGSFWRGCTTVVEITD